MRTTDVFGLSCYFAVNLIPNTFWKTSPYIGQPRSLNQYWKFKILKIVCSWMKTFIFETKRKKKCNIKFRAKRNWREKRNKMKRNRKNFLDVRMLMGSQNYSRKKNVWGERKWNEMRKNFILGFNKSQSYQILISLLLRLFLLSLFILKNRQYFLMLQTLKLNNEKRKKSLFYEEKSLVGLTPE